MAKIFSLLLLCATCQAGTVHIVLTNWPYLPPTNTLQIFQTRPSVSGIYFAYGNPIRIPYRGVGIYTNFFTGRYEFRIEGFTFNPPIQFPVPDCDCTNEFTSLIVDGVSMSFTNPAYVTRVIGGTNTTVQTVGGIATVNSSGGQSQFPYTAITNAPWASTNYIDGLSNEFNIFNSIASNVVAACRFTYASGGDYPVTNSYQPSGNGFYGAYILRDAAISMDAAPWLWSNTDWTNMMMQAKALQPNVGSPTDAGVMTGIDIDGLFLSASPNPSEYDGGFYLLRMAYAGWKRTGQIWFYTNCQTQISNAFAYYAVSNHLAYITNVVADRRPGWGFEDTIRLYGVNAYLNALRHEACRELSEIHSYLGHTADATWYTNECGWIRTNLQQELWDSNMGLYRACSAPATNSTKHSVIASTYIALVGACSNGIALTIAYKLSDLRDTATFRQGTVRHLLVGENWMEEVNPGSAIAGYQDGGYWPMFGTWVWRVIRTVNADQADRGMQDLAGRYRAQSATDVANEWEYNLSNGQEQYMTSACVPGTYWSEDPFKR